MEGLSSREFVGELALSGKLRRVKGVLPAALAANKVKRRLVVPHFNGDQAALVGHDTHQSADSLLEVCADICGQQSLDLHQSMNQIQIVEQKRDLQDIIGQQQGKRAPPSPRSHLWKCHL